MIETEYKYSIPAESAKLYLEKLTLGLLPNEKIVDIVTMEQFYLADADNVAVRGRISSHTNGDSNAILAIKSANAGLSRLEIEKNLTEDEASALSKLAVSRLTKTRYIIECKDSVWDFDVFSGNLDGTVYAEIEVANESVEFDMISCTNMVLVDGREHSNAFLANLVSNTN